MEILRTLIPASSSIIGIGELKERASTGQISYQCTVIGTGTVSAKADIKVSNDGLAWLTVAQVTLSGASTDTFMQVFSPLWDMLKIDCTEITGTNAVFIGSVGG